MEGLAFNGRKERANQELGIAMSDILQKLHQDHIHMAQVLDVLDRQLDIIRHPESGDDADMNLIRESALYFMTFPDKVHHVAEDKVFEKTEQVAPDMKPQFEKLRSDHVALASVGKEFHEMMDNLCSGQVMQRAELVAEIEKFIDVQREHMNLEEGKIFPEAKSSLSKTNIDEIEAEYEASVDPIFGPKVEKYFEQIRQAIVQET